MPSAIVQHPTPAMCCPCSSAERNSPDGCDYFIVCAGAELRRAARHALGGTLQPTNPAEGHGDNLVARGEVANRVVYDRPNV